MSQPLTSAEPTADLCLWFLLDTGSNYVLRYETGDEKYGLGMKRSYGRVFTRSVENNAPLGKFGGADVRETSPQVPAYADLNDPFTRNPPTS